MPSQSLVDAEKAEKEEWRSSQENLSATADPGLPRT